MNITQKITRVALTLGLAGSAVFVALAPVGSQPTKTIDLPTAVVEADSSEVEVAGDWEFTRRRPTARCRFVRTRGFTPGP